MNTAASPYLRHEAAPAGLWVFVALGLVAFAIACGVSLALGEIESLYVTMALVLCIAVIYDYRIGVVTLMLLLPVQTSSLFPHALFGVTGLNPQNLLLVATVGAFILHGHARAPGIFLQRPLLLLYVLPLAVGGVIGASHAEEIAPFFYEAGTLNFNEWGGYLRDMFAKPMLTVVLALLVGAAAASSQKPERFIVPIALSVWLVALLQIGFVIASGVHFGLLASSSERGFFSAIGMHANDLGRLLAAAYALLLFPWWETKKPGLKLFLFLTMGVLSFALLLTFSRGAFLGFILINVMFLVWKFNMKTLGLTLIVLFICATLMPGYVIDRVTVGFDSGDTEEISAGRIEGIWAPLLPEVAKSPLWGSGLLSTTWSLPMEAGSMPPVTHPHNAFLEALLDLGVIGLGLLLAYFWHVWRGFRALGSNAYLSPDMRAFFQGSCAALIVFLVTGWTGSSLRPEAEFGYLWIAIGMMYGMLARKPEGQTIGQPAAATPARP
jgi:O-antigen ligase